MFWKYFWVFLSHFFYLWLKSKQKENVENFVQIVDNLCFFTHTVFIYISVFKLHNLFQKNYT